MINLEINSVHESGDRKVDEVRRCELSWALRIPPSNTIWKIPFLRSSNSSEDNERGEEMFVRFEEWRKNRVRARYFHLREEIELPRVC